MLTLLGCLQATFDVHPVDNFRVSTIQRMGAKLSSSSKNDLSENYLTYLTEHTGLQREQVLLNIPKKDLKTLLNFEGPRLLHKI